MVNTVCYPAPDNRRFSLHRVPYPAPVSPADHRRLNSGYYFPFDPTRAADMTTGGHEEPLPQRKRIPVACGRCRKRKIRCSGDNGMGEQCTNCRNAGASPCLFLRVSSQEATFKQDGGGGSGFNYNLVDSRTHQARGLTALPASQPPTSVPLPSYQEGLASAGPGPMDALPYRNGHAYTYAPSSSGRTYLPWSGPSGYCDSVPDHQHAEVGYSQHSLYAAAYGPQAPAQPESRYVSSYQPAPPPPKPLPPYVDTESTAYGFGGHGGSVSVPTTSTTATLVHRPAPTSDAGNNSWFHSIATGLSSSAGGEGKVAVPPPVPVERSPQAPGLQHQPQQEQQHPHQHHHHPWGRNDSVSSTAYSKSSSSPTSSLPEMTPTSSYGTASFESSPVSYTHSTAAGLQQPPSASRSGDLYAAASTAAAAAAAPVTASSSSSGFPPPSTSSYSYADTSVAAAAVAARRSPIGSSSGSSNSHHHHGGASVHPSPMYAILSDMGEGRKATPALRS